MQFSLKRRLNRSSVTSVAFLLVRCASETIFLLVPAHCLSASPAVTQRMNRCHTPQNGVIACHSPSRQFILLDVAHAPQIFISFCSRAAASIAKRSGGGSVPREGEGRGGGGGCSVGTCNGAEGRGRDVWALSLCMPSRSIFLCLKPPVAVVMAARGLAGAFGGCATGDEGFGSGEAKVSDDFPSRPRFIFGGEASASPLREGNR